MSMNRDSQEVLAAIEAWFREHDDGAFSIAPSDHFSVRIGDATLARTVVYTTKPSCLSRVRSLLLLASPVAVLGRYGLPAVADLPFVLGNSPNRIFIGDCDPPDILIFAWLREHLPIVWHGVNDAFLERHGTRSLDGIRIPMLDSELATVSILPRLCPDFRQLVGEYCASILDDGFKIEIEGATMDRNASATI